MTRYTMKSVTRLAVLLVTLAVVCSVGVDAAVTRSKMITTVTGPFNFVAKDGYISTPEGGSIYMWGYANADTGSVMQFPGPIMEVNEGDTVTVTLTNELSEPVSLIFPGQGQVTASGGQAGPITREAVSGGGAVTYTFVASNPGTYYYTSGSDMKLQTEMGLVGALIVRSSTPMQAYDSPDTMYDRETLFLESEVDPIIHELVETGRKAEVDWSKYFPVYWFFNGRCAPDTMAEDNVPWLPHQPYSTMPRMHPGEALLLRIVAAGQDMHPFHQHGNDVHIIARDGNLLSSGPGMGADLLEQNFTTTVTPAGTMDGLFYWTGEKLGWDIYGHAPGDPMEPNEYAPDHGKPIPVALPDPKDLAYGEFYSGSPFLGVHGYVPPVGTVKNLTAGYFYMWHSHKEKEMVNDDVFPGGMMTMLIVEHPSVPIP